LEGRCPQRPLLAGFFRRESTSLLNAVLLVLLLSKNEQGREQEKEHEQEEEKLARGFKTRPPGRIRNAHEN
jgi:hypothetical protein